MGAKRDLRQPWDVALPGLEPEEPAPKPLTQSGEGGLRPAYRRYRTTQVNRCDDCTEDFVAGRGTQIADASWIRSFQGESRYLCFAHGQARKDEDAKAEAARKAAEKTEEEAKLMAIHSRNQKARRRKGPWHGQ